MITSAIALWKKFNTTTPLGESEWGVEVRHGKRFSHVTYSGHKVQDGMVRIYAQFIRPASEDKRPAILLLPDAGKPLDRELADYFVDKGYAVLMPDYSGKMSQDTDGSMRTLYPESLSYANYEKAELYHVPEEAAEKNPWFEWTYVALFSVKYLKSRSDIGGIGVIGVRAGGEIAWQTMLSPDVKCGIPVNAIGWNSFMHMAKFGDNVGHTLTDDAHRFIAGVEAQSYAPSVKCPVLMLCALRDNRFDCDRAYDTYSRIGEQDGSALVYSQNTGECIGPHALTNMDLFLEKNLKGREIYIPDTLNVTVKESEEGKINIKVDCDKEGILEEVGIYYAEADVNTRSSYREWIHALKLDGKLVKNGEVEHVVTPFPSAKAVFVYAYAKYINGFRVMSKIVAKKRSNPDLSAVKSRMLFSGKEMDCFSIADNEEIAIGDILLEKEGVPKSAEGYGEICGAYSKGGIKTYRISSPQYIPDENALLEFDVYATSDDELTVSIEVADVESEMETYSCSINVKGGGKWKRIILKSGDLKGETGMPLTSFNKGKALLFNSKNEETEFAITNILWL